MKWIVAFVILWLLSTIVARAHTENYAKQAKKIGRFVSPEKATTTAIIFIENLLMIFDFLSAYFSFLGLMLTIKW